MLIARKANETVINSALVAFFSVSFIMFLYIFVTYVGNFSTWFHANYYIYEQKNSAAQIIGCTIITTAFLIHPGKKWGKIAKFAAIMVLLLITVAIQCRAALLSLLVTAAVYYLLVLKGRKKFAVTLALIAAIVLVYSNNHLLQYIQKAFVFTKRQAENLDYFTSGRLTNYRHALGIIRENPLVGTGHYRVDNLYLCLLADVGLAGFLPIMVLWLSRITRNMIAFHKEKTPFTSCVLCLTVFYLCESVSEAYPPFGPGVCSFMFWIICAFLDSKPAGEQSGNPLASEA